jgi:hypothetical protein
MRNLTDNREERLKIILEAAIYDHSPVMNAILRRYGLEPPKDLMDRIAARQNN